MKCVIIAGGAVSDYDLLLSRCVGADLIICADAGIMHADKMNFAPDIWVGDFDSSCQHGFCAKRQIRLPREKDDTDTMYAARVALREGADEVTLLAASGSRLDHTLANLFVLKFLEDNGASARMEDEHNTVMLVKSSARITKTDGSYLSLLPFCSVPTGVTVNGVKYPLDNAALYDNNTLGVSNEITAPYAELSVKCGCLAVFISKD